MITIQAGYALVIDDEPANRDFLERLLQTASFKVSGAGTQAEALRLARSVPALALAVVDQELPDATGLELIAQLRKENPEALLVMATMHDDRSLIDRAFEAGVDVFLVKPNGFMELYRRLREVDSDTTLLRQLVIDQYGPRPYRGGKKPAAAPTKPSVEPTKEASPSADAAKPAPAPTDKVEPAPVPPKTGVVDAKEAAIPPKIEGVGNKEAAIPPNTGVVDNTPIPPKIEGVGNKEGPPAPTSEGTHSQNPGAQANGKHE